MDYLGQSTESAENTAYDNATSGLTATDVQAALDELKGSYSGDVVGPTGATPDALVRFDLGTGKLIKESTSLLASESTMLNIGGAAYTNVQQSQDIFHSAGHISGGVVTDNLDGSVAVTAGEGFIRDANSSVAPLYFMAWPAKDPLTLTDANLNYVYVEYNSGTPQVTASTTEPNEEDQTLLATVRKDGTTLHITNAARHTIGDHAKLMIERNKKLGYIKREENGGAILSETGTLNIAITQGRFWIGLTEYKTNAFDSSGTDTFSYFYNSASYVEVDTRTAIDADNYDNAGTLTALNNNQYGVHWVYLGADSDVYVIYGTQSYSLTDARDNATPPSALPPHFTKHAVLIAKIIIKKGESTFTSITSAFATPFTSGAASVNVVNGEPTANTIARFDTNQNTIKGSSILIDDSGHVIPQGNGTQDLGNNDARYKDLYLNGTLWYPTVRAASGDANIPGLGFVNVGTGLYELPGNGIGFTVSGERMRIQSTGEVGIGQSTPETSLHVQKDQDAVTAILVENNTTGLNASARYRCETDTANSNLNMVAYGSGVATTTGAGGPLSGLIFSGTAATNGLSIASTGGNMRFYTGGQALANERMRIDASGNVGIGVTPDQPLHVEKNQNTATVIKVKNTDAGTNASSRMRCETNVTGNDVQLLAWGSGVTASGAVQPSSSLLYSGSAASNGLSIATSHPSADMLFYTAGLNASNERMRISSTGNVGIGVSPSQPLHVQKNQSNPTMVLVKNTDAGTNASARFTCEAESATNAIQMIVYGSGVASSGAVQPSGGLIYTGSTSSGGLSIASIGTSADMRFYTAGLVAGNERMRITSAGYVGIGQTSPGILCHIGNGGTNHSVRIQSNTSSGLRLMDPTGNAVVSIGCENTTTPDMIFKTTGGVSRIRMANEGHWHPETGASYDLGLTGSRWRDCYLTNNPTVTSDANLKEIYPEMKCGLDAIMKLKPIAYKWKDYEVKETHGHDPDKQKTVIRKVKHKRTHYGFGAQDIAKLIETGEWEDSGLYVKDGDNHGLRMGELIAPLVKAVQELSARLDTVARVQTATQRKSFDWL